jgi:phospholipid transport system substrate-binding protein
MQTLNRRHFVGAILAISAVGAAPASALDVDGARDLIAALVKDINKVINSGKGEVAMFRDFERVFVKYADIGVIARKVMGVDWRRATAAQRTAFTAAFQKYISKKYGRRFREFVGGEIEVTRSRKVKSVFEVVSIAKLRGQAPFEVRWLVADKNGQPRMFNMFIEGINMSSTERTEIGAMLDNRGGDINKLIAHLKTAG